jgi:hypothetical protein
MREAELHSPPFEIRPDECSQTCNAFNIASLAAGDVRHVSTPSGSTRLFDCFLKPDLYDE